MAKTRKDGQAAAAVAMGVAAGAIATVASKLHVGDRVRVQTMSFTGDGVITEISTDVEKGGGTKLYPAFHVQFDDGARGWFNGISLRRLARRAKPVVGGVFLRPLRSDWFFWWVTLLATVLLVGVVQEATHGRAWYGQAILLVAVAAFGLAVRVRTLARRKGRSPWIGAIVVFTATALFAIGTVLAVRAADNSPSVSGDWLAGYLNANTTPAVGSPVISETFRCDAGPWHAGDTASCDVKVIGNLTQPIDVRINNIVDNTLDLSIDISR